MRSTGTYLLPRRLRPFAALLALALTPLVTMAQQAMITGRVTDKVSGAPLPEARIFVVGTTLGAITNAEGRYSIRGVPPGVQEVRTLRVGYHELKKSITLTPGATGVADFLLE